MNDLVKKVNLVLIADRPSRASLLQDTLATVRVDGEIRRVSPGIGAVNCVRQCGAYRRSVLPDLFIFDFTNPDENTVSTLRSIAFGKDKSAVPIIVLTSPESQEILDSGDIDGGEAIMFSPTSLVSFTRKMRSDNRNRFLKALHTLYEFGPILVRAPQAVLFRDRCEMTESA